MKLQRTLFNSVIRNKQIFNRPRVSPEVSTGVVRNGNQTRLGDSYFRTGTQTQRAGLRLPHVAETSFRRYHGRPWTPVGMPTDHTVLSAKGSVWQVIDAQGQKRSVIDMSSLVSKLFGYNHPHVNASIKRTLEMGLGGLPPREMTRNREKFHEILLENLGLDPQAVVFPYSDGQSGVEAAAYAIWDFQNKAKGRKNGEVGTIFTKNPSFHGGGLASALFGTDPRKESKKGMVVAPVRPELPHPQREEDIDAALALSEKLIDSVADFDGVILEPEGGSTSGLVGYTRWLRELTDLVHRKGGKIFFDEVMSGAGRTGHASSAIGRHGITDLDGLVLAKNLNNCETPLSTLVIADPDMVESYKNRPFMYGSTNSANEYGLAAALACEELRTPEFLSDVVGLGNKIQEMLEAKKEVCPSIADIRGTGALQTVVLQDCQSKEPLPAETVKEIVREAGKMGASYFGIQNRIMVTPAGNIPAEELERGISILVEAINRVVSK